MTDVRTAADVGVRARQLLNFESHWYPHQADMEGLLRLEFVVSDSWL